jgi:hypothetical protein
MKLKKVTLTIFAPEFSGLSDMAEFATQDLRGGAPSSSRTFSGGEHYNYTVHEATAEEFAAETNEEIEE